MKSMRNILLAGLLLIGILTGCGTTEIYDARGASDVCEVHHAYMHSERIRTPANVMPSQDYLNARLKFFPHAYPFYLPKIAGRYEVNICDYCVRAEEAWKTQNHQ
jgi:hypothetical protein